MRQLALKIAILWGWRRYGLAFLSGAAAVLALPPVNFLPVVFISFPILVWLLDGAGSGRGRSSDILASALVGWVFGFGYFLAGLYWLGQAFLVDADTFAWMIPFAVTLLPAGLALFTAMVCVAARLFWPPGLARILALAAAWAGFEWLRAIAFTGFPWNAIGYAFAGSDEISQILSVIGIYGLSFATVLTAAAPAVLIGNLGGQAPRPGLWAWRGVIVSVVLLGGLWGFGAHRLATNPADYVKNTRLRIVQPNIPQKEKWRPENRSDIFATLLELSNKATSPGTMGIEDVTHVIWPESAIPFLLEDNANARAAIAALLPPGTVLITGALRRNPDRTAPGTTPGISGKILNSVLIINDEGETVSVYDKFHLVPFGEYLPWEDFLSGFAVRQIVTAPASFARGPGPRLITLDGAPPVAPLVCYEAIFPRHVKTAARPGWLLNVTNDAWFGQSQGPLQHFAQARARAVEQGVPLIRAANTGISAAIDPYGRVIRRLDLNRRGVIDVALPQALKPTIYARFGDWIFLCLLGLAAAMAVLGHVRSAANLRLRA